MDRCLDMPSFCCPSLWSMFHHRTTWVFCHFRIRVLYHLRWTSGTGWNLCCLPCIGYMFLISCTIFTASIYIYIYIMCVYIYISCIYIYSACNIPSFLLCQHGGNDVEATLLLIGKILQTLWNLSVSFEHVWNTLAWNWQYQAYFLEWC